MISVCAICNGRQKSEVVRIAQLETENAKLKEAAKAMLAELNCHHRENSPAARKLAALIQEKKRETSES